MRASSGSESWRLTPVSLWGQAAALLRDAIRSGELENPLPGENELAERLGISRPSVRVALGRLASEGLIEIRKGVRTRIVARPDPAGRTGRPAVCVICPGSSERLNSDQHPLLLEMHAQFASRGIRWEQVFDARIATRNPTSRLEKIVRGRPSVCWILFAAPEQIQRWFAGAGVRTLVVGSCAPGLTLPSVDRDYAAVGRHAAGAILRQGHTRVGLALPTALLPGDLAFRHAFAGELDRHRGETALFECRSPSNVIQLRTRLHHLLASPMRPTVIVSMRPVLTLTILEQVYRMGLRIPRDISLVQRDTHPLIKEALPEITCYDSSVRKLASSAVKIATALLAGRSVPERPTLLTPTFSRGATLTASPGAM